MPEGYITPESVAELRAVPGKKNFLWDTKISGFGVYVTSRGRAVYVLQYRMGGREAPTRRYTIGRHGSPWTPKMARRRALELLGKIVTGIDPLKEEQAARKEIEEDINLRFSNYVLKYIELHIRKKGLRSGDKTIRVIERDLMPAFGDKVITKITKKEISDHLNDLALISKGTANHAFSAMRGLISFALQQSDLEKDPMTELKKPFQFVPRETFLAGWELQRVWEAAHDLPKYEGAAVLLLLLTALRLTEVTNASWDEFDLEESVWVIPAERMKNKKAHVVPLTKTMLDVIYRVWPSEDDRQGTLFNPLQDKTRDSARLKVWLDEAVARRLSLQAEAEGKAQAKEMKKFTFHDLRRSVATGLQRLGVPIEHTEAVLSHISGSRNRLVNTYQKHQYDNEKRDALEKWDRHLVELMDRPDAWPGGRQLPALRVPGMRLAKIKGKA